MGHSGVGGDERHHIVISITTFRRPELLDQLLMLVLDYAQQNSGLMEVSILVVDNDPDASAKEVVTSYVNVKYVLELQPGIAAARQRALDEAADGALLICLDDDVLPTGNWLVPLVDAWKHYSATIVTGFVEYVYPDNTDKWVIDGGFMRRDEVPTGTILGASEAGNILIDVERVKRQGVKFDPTLGFSGGEDTLFSKQVARAGGIIVACHESVVLGHVPFERTTRRFCVARARSHGSASVLVSLRMASSQSGRLTVRLKSVAGGALRMLWGLARGLRGAFSAVPGRASGGVRTAARGYGMLGAALGSQMNEYDR